MTTAESCPRRGITILEVLIALGILAIGLSSVVALIPAARSQAVRAVVLDRASLLAANTLADAATFGLLRAGSDALAVGDPRPEVVVLDVAGTTLRGPGDVVRPNVLARQSGIFYAGAAAPIAAQRLWLQSRDDIVVAPAASDDDPPTNRVIDGARGFEGRMTSLLCLSGTGNGPYRASVVVFHNRDTSDPSGLVISGTMNNLGLNVASLLPALPPGRTVTDIVKPGVVLWDQTGERFHQAVAVAPNGDSSVLFLTLSSGASLGTATNRAVQILPDSIGLAERTFTPEGVGVFTR